MGCPHMPRDRLDGLDRGHFDCWAVSLIGYLFDEPADLVFPLVTFGALTGVAEWVARSKER